MTSAPLPQPRFRASRTLRAIVVGLAVSCTAPVLADNLPEMPESYNNLAVLYARQNLYDKARMALEMAIQAHPTYATAYENLGDLHAKQASQAYAKAVQLDAGSKTAKAKLALARDLIARPAKPAPIPAAQPAEAVAAPARTENASSETSR